MPFPFQFKATYNLIATALLLSQTDDTASGDVRGRAFDKDVFTPLI